jgi:DNA-binding response OmpR family regulator
VNAATQPAILLVEDDPLLAMDVETVLAAAGYRVIGPARTSADAVSILRHQTPDLTILDLNLGGEMVFPVFDYLDRAGTPFIILSGHSRQLVPPRHAKRPFLQKPYSQGTLLQMVRTMLHEGPENISSAVG